jgi:hypothetical protein
MVAADLGQLGRYQRNFGGNLPEQRLSHGQPRPGVAAQFVQAEFYAMTLAKRLSGTWPRGEKVSDFRQPLLPMLHADECDEGSEPGHTQIC